MVGDKMYIVVREFESGFVLDRATPPLTSLSINVGVRKGTW